MKKYYPNAFLSILLVALFLTKHSTSQVSINTGLTPQQLVQTMLGIAVSATNVTFTATLTTTGGFIKHCHIVHIRNRIIIN